MHEPEPLVVGFRGLVTANLMTAVIGGCATTSAVQDWYPTLVKPAWTPPAWVFGPVWTLLYATMALAAWLVWRRAGWGGALGWYAAQLLLNAAWSPVFFGMQRIDWALGILVALWLAVARTTVAFAKVSPLASGLFLPYLAWVSFAAVLNFALWRLNS